jgi:quercetin dioxygenase-like cupin family protein
MSPVMHVFAATCTCDEARRCGDRVSVLQTQSVWLDYKRSPLWIKARGERVEVGGITVLRAVFEPGWHYTEHVEPQVCQSRHAGYIVSGRLRVAMDDGSETEAGPGDVVVIEPGHDAWTVGGEPCVMIDFGESVSIPGAGTGEAEPPPPDSDTAQAPGLTKSRKHRLQADGQDCRRSTQPSARLRHGCSATRSPVTALPTLPTSRFA